MSENENEKPIKRVLPLAILIVVIVLFLYMLHISADPSAKPYDSNPAPSANQTANATPSPSAPLNQSADNTVDPTMSSTNSLQADFHTVNVGDSQSNALEAVGRQPDKTYQGADGGTVLYYRDGPLDSDFNELRIMVKNGFVYEVSYMPSDGPVSNAQIKLPNHRVWLGSTPVAVSNPEGSIVSNPAPSANQASAASTYGPYKAVTYLQVEYEMIDIGERQPSVIHEIGVQPTRSYRAHDKAKGEMLEFSSPDNGGDLLRVELVKGLVTKVTYIPVKGEEESKSSNPPQPVRKTVLVPKPLNYGEAFEQLTNEINNAHADSADLVINGGPDPPLLVTILSNQKSISYKEQIGQKYYRKYSNLRRRWGLSVAASDWWVIVEGPHLSEPVVITNANGSRLGP